MITARALVERNETTMRLIQHHPSETTRSIQLYGVDPKTMGAATRILVEEDHADHIDMNFGCPVPKVTRKGGGAARQASSTNGQRLAKRQPLGTLSGLGGSPCRRMRSLRFCPRASIERCG